MVITCEAAEFLPFRLRFAGGGVVEGVPGSLVLVAAPSLVGCKAAASSNFFFTWPYRVWVTLLDLKPISAVTASQLIWKMSEFCQPTAQVKLTSGFVFMCLNIEVKNAASLPEGEVGLANITERFCALDE